MKLQERNTELKKLKAIKERADKGIHLHKDYADMAAILMKLLKSVKVD
ncbi:hypothetical protein AAXE64_08285 [Priestia megaterium]